MESETKNSWVLVLVTVVLLLLGVSLTVKGVGLFEKREVLPEKKTVPAVKEASNSTSSVQGVSGEEATVIKVIDGDTIELQLGEGISKVRYIGIDTPETVDPRRPVGCFGKEASTENKSLVERKNVYLVKDISNHDKFNRLLRYVYLKLEDGNTLFVNDYLVRQGFAKAATFPPDIKYQQQFLQAEREARENRRGLWEKCSP